MCQQGGIQYNKGEYRRAFQYFTKAAGLGDANAHFKMGFVSKEVLATALRAHKAAVDATKSPQRKAAEEFNRFL